MEKIIKEFTTIDADLNTFIGLRKHMRARHNKKHSQPETEIKENENNGQDDIIAMILDNASKVASLSKIRKLIFH